MDKGSFLHVNMQCDQYCIFNVQTKISEITVKSHRGRVMFRMKGNSLPDLVRMASAFGPAPEAIRLHGNSDEDIFRRRNKGQGP
jgi:hypothetical protein